MKTFLLAAILVLQVFFAHADEESSHGKGHRNFSIGGGNGQAFNSHYFIISASASYYAMDGLSVGASFESWSGGNHGITKIAPSVQYVFYEVPGVQPYLGGFYRHTSVSGLPNIDSYGARVGVNMASGSNAYVSAGLVYENYVGCQQTIYSSCRSTYPDVNFNLGF
jgi:hypothetical protein